MQPQAALAQRELGSACEAGAPRTHRAHLFVSFADQALMSAVSFGAGMSLVAFAPKHEFAVFSLVVALSHLTQNLQNAVIVTPLTANSPWLSSKVRHSFWMRMIHLGTIGSLVCAAACAVLVLAGVSGIPAGSALLAAACFLSVIGLWAREQRRSLQFVRLEPWSVLKGDVAFACLVGLGLAGVFLWTRQLSTVLVLSVLGIAGLATGAVRILAVREPGESFTDLRSILARQVRYTVPSVFLSWLSGNAYVYVIAHQSGMNALAETNATRLFVAPLALVQVAWNRIFLPSAGLSIAAGEHRKAVQMGLTGVGVLAVGSLALGALVIAISQFPGSVALWERIGASSALLAGWLIYFFVAGARGFGTSFHIAETAFARLFRIGLLGAVVSIIGMLVLGELFGPIGVVSALVLGELTMGFVLWRLALSRRTA